MSRPRYVKDHDDGAPTAITELTAEFGTLRPRLLAVAYGLLGSVDEAEDVVQEAWPRLHGRGQRGR